MEDVMILLVGPSGSGKSTIANTLSDQYNLKALPSYTTRPPRYEGEQGHLFVTDSEFNALHDIVAYTEYDGYRYCATADQIDKNDIYVVDLDGCESLVEKYQGSKRLMVFWIDCPPMICAERVMARDGGLSGVQRIVHDGQAFSRGLERLRDVFDTVYVIQNTESVEAAANEIMCCVDFAHDD